MLRFNVALAIAPALLFFWLFQRWDQKRPEPLGAVRNMMLLGTGTVIPAIIVELTLSHVLGEELLSAQGGLVNAFVVAALTEEFFKLAVVLAFLWRKPHFDEVMDGMLYTAAASLGFAVVENVLYSATNPITGFMRAFTAVPMHAACSAIMGYFIGRARISRGSAVPWVLAGLTVGVGIHGAYDWALFSGGTFGFDAPSSWLGLVYAFAIVVVAALTVLGLVKHSLKLDDALHGPNFRPLFAQPSPQQPYPYPYPQQPPQQASPYPQPQPSQQPYPHPQPPQAYAPQRPPQQPYPYPQPPQGYAPQQPQPQPYPYPQQPQGYALQQPQPQPYPYPQQPPQAHPQQQSPEQQPYPYPQQPPPKR